MTRTWTIISVALGAILVSGVILSLVAPKRITVTSRTFIRADRALVYDHLRHMRYFPQWSPFLAEDPGQHYRIEGRDGNLGASYHWEGKAVRSKGFQQVTDLRENSAVTIQCHIEEPFQTDPLFRYQLHPRDNGTELVQVFDAEMPFPSNVIGMLLGLKTNIAKTNGYGLALLKDLVEKGNNNFVSAITTSSPQH